jgi:hypothetical protein
MKNKLNTHGIYCLYFENSNEKYYIGKSLDIQDRYDIHCRDLRNKAHHNIELQNAYNKYKVYPSIEILEVPKVSELAKSEIHWIKEFDAYYSGYNRTGGGEGAGYGATSPSALYDEETYVTILYMLAYSKLSMVSISNELSVHVNVINSIALKKSHTYLKEVYPEVYTLATNIHGNYSTNRKHSEDIYYNILSDLANTGDKYNIIANRYNVNQGVIEDIGRGSTHKYLQQSHPEVYAKMIQKKNTRRSGPQSGRAYPPVKSPEGTVYNITNATAFAKNNNLHPGHFGDLLRGKIKSHKKWVLA